MCRKLQKNVLIIEDTKSYRDELEEIFKDSGFNVHMYNGYEEYCQDFIKIHSTKFDIAILDRMVRSFDTIRDECIPHLRKFDNINCHIILYSSLYSEEAIGNLENVSYFGKGDGLDLEYIESKISK